MALVVLGLGSNLGDAAATIKAAFARLAAGILEDARLSRLYRSKPLYLEEQPDFVNAAAAGRASLGPRELLRELNRIEADFGRDRLRELRNGPRSLDIDILLYGDLVLDDPELILPHPRLAERLFALLPLLELEPGLIDPLGGEPYAKIAKSLPEQGIYLIG